MIFIYLTPCVPLSFKASKERGKEFFEGVSPFKLSLSFWPAIHLENKKSAFLGV